MEATGATTIPQGKLILSISNQSGEWLQEVIRSLAPGDSVDISITAPDTRWEDVTYAVGGLYWILKDGVVDTSLSDGAAAPAPPWAPSPTARWSFTPSTAGKLATAWAPPFKWWPSG